MRLGERLPQAHDDTRYAAIADDHVRPEPQRHHRRFRIERCQKFLQVRDVRRLEQHIRRAAGLEPGQRCEAAPPSSNASDAQGGGARHTALMMPAPWAGPPPTS